MSQWLDKCQWTSAPGLERTKGKPQEGELSERGPGGNVCGRLVCLARPILSRYGYLAARRGSKHGKEWVQIWCAIGVL